MVDNCKTSSRIVGTGSGMVALLSAMRHERVSALALWDAVTHVSIGREPPAPAALAMAERIVAAYSVGWPADVQQAITAQRLVNELAPSKHGDLTSARPALVAYTASLVSVASAGSADDVLGLAVARVLNKL